MCDGVKGVGIGLMLKQKVGHAQVAMGGRVEEALVEGQGGLVVEQGLDKADFALAGGEEDEWGEFCRGEGRKGEE